MRAWKIIRLAGMGMLLLLAIGNSTVTLAQQTAVVWTGAVVVAQEISRETLVGVVKEGEYGLELVTGDQTYVLEDYLPEEMLGRKVKITGSVEETEDGTMLLTVDAYEPVEEK